MFSRRQALRAGLTERQIDRPVAAGRYEIIHPGVYRVVGSVHSARQRARAGCLWCGDRAVTSHLTAGALLALDGVRTEDVHVLVPHEVRRAWSSQLQVHRTATLARVDRVIVDRIPCTSATRTIVDLAALLDDEPLEVAFESARRMGLTSPDDLGRAVERLAGRGRPGNARLDRLLAHQRPGDRPAEYRLEVKTERLLRASGLPRPVRQFWVTLPDSTRYRLDFAWLALTLGRSAA